MKTKLIIVLTSLIFCTSCIFADNKGFRFDGTVGIYVDFGYRNAKCQIINNEFVINAFMNKGKYVVFSDAINLLPEYKEEFPYYQYQAKFGDFNPNDGIWVSKTWGQAQDTAAGEPHCFHECINNIEITALNDWNEELVAGADISHLFTMEYKTTMPYIERGFTGEKENLVSQAVTDVLQNPISLLSAKEPIKFKAKSLPSNGNVQIEIIFTLDSDREETCVVSLL